MWGSRERQPDLSTLKITSFYTVHSVPMIETDRPHWKRIPQIVQASTGLCPMPSAILLSSIYWCRKPHTAVFPRQSKSRSQLTVLWRV